MRLEALVLAHEEAATRETVGAVREALRGVHEHARISVVESDQGPTVAFNDGLRAALLRRATWDAVLLVRAGAVVERDGLRALLDAVAAREDLGVARHDAIDAALVGAGCLEAIGLFDESFRDAFALEDLAERARLAGFFVPGAGRRRARAGAERTTAWLEGRARYLTKHHGAAYRRVADAALALGGVWAVARERARGIRSEESRRWLGALLRQASSRSR